MVVIALLLLSVSGCKKNYIINDKQAILFQLEYVNHAWGYQHYGYLIDNQGNILTYNNPVNWNFPDKSFYLSETHVNENISKCIKAAGKISEEELQKYTSYITNIASSKVTALKNMSLDAGSTEFICYQFSESNKVYRGYLIKMEGDFTCENLNFYSKKVTAWMKEIHTTIAGN